MTTKGWSRSDDDELVALAQFGHDTRDVVVGADAPARRVIQARRPTGRPACLHCRDVQPEPWRRERFRCAERRQVPDRFPMETIVCS
jgi:hypothetical protein